MTIVCHDSIGQLTDQSQLDCFGDISPKGLAPALSDKFLTAGGSSVVMLCLLDNGKGAGCYEARQRSLDVYSVDWVGLRSMPHELPLFLSTSANSTSMFSLFCYLKVIDCLLFKRYLG